MVFAELEEEEGEKVVLFSDDLSHQVSAEVIQALQRLVYSIDHKRGGKPAKVKALGNHVGISDVALARVAEGLLKCLDRARVESIDTGA